MIKLSNDQSLASGFAKIFMDIVRTYFLNIIFTSCIYDTILPANEPCYELFYRLRRISDEISQDIRRRISYGDST